MKVTENQLQDLLEISALDQQMQRDRASLLSLGEDAEYLGLQRQLRDSSADLISASNRIDGLKLDLKRLETDVELVAKREAKDQAALRTTSVVKDAQGLQQELKTLEKRRGELEEQQLQIMEQLEEAGTQMAVVTKSRSETEELLRVVIARLESSKTKLLSGLELSQATRKQLVERVPTELMSLFETKSKRGVAIGRLTNSQCGACRMGLSATALSEVSRVPHDEIASCPDCGAILVR
ncbi:MAG: zinc ribbon domain-containing protein [Micrococcales bacterium]